MRYRRSLISEVSYIAAILCLLRLRNADTLWIVDWPDPTADMVSDL